MEIIFFQAFTKNPSILSKQGRRKVVYSIQEFIDLEKEVEYESVNYTSGAFSLLRLHFKKPF